MSSWWNDSRGISYQGLLRPWHRWFLKEGVLQIQKSGTMPNVRHILRRTSISKTSLMISWWMTISTSTWVTSKLPTQMWIWVLQRFPRKEEICHENVFETLARPDSKTEPSPISNHGLPSQLSFSPSGQRNGILNSHQVLPSVGVRVGGGNKSEQSTIKKGKVGIQAQVLQIQETVSWTVNSDIFPSQHKAIFLKKCLCRGASKIKKGKVLCRTNLKAGRSLQPFLGAFQPPVTGNLQWKGYIKEIHYAGWIWIVFTCILMDWIEFCLAKAWGNAWGNPIHFLLKFLEKKINFGHK